MTIKQKFFADDGWAVWIDGDDLSTIYLDEWLNPKEKSYVDIAIHTRGIKGAKALNLYIPFSVSKEEVLDLSLLLQDKKILYAKFNAACVIDYQKNDYTSELAYHGKTLDVIHISKLGYTLEPLENGTLFRVDLDKVQEFLDNDEVYFLFRIPHKSLDQIFAPQMDVKGLFQRLRNLITTPVKTEKYGYSMRINEIHLIPARITRIGAFHRQRLKRAVISISISDEYEVNDQGCYRIKRLEEQLYQRYVPDEFSCENAITYQWEQDRGVNVRGHFNFYFSLARNSVSPMSMVIYMILLVLVGSAGSALFELIKLLVCG